MTDLLTDLHELEAVSRSYETAEPQEIIRWTVDRFGDEVIVAASFEDAVLPHLVATHIPAAEVVLLDTQYLFAETEWFADRLRRDLRLRLTVVTPAPDVERDDRWQHDVEGCCGVGKVEPLARALAGRAAWVTGLRRVDAPTRATTPVVEWDQARSMVKVNPLAAWTDDDLEAYQREHALLRNPLVAKGYLSIGCWPCTRPVAPGEDRRAGRWAGQAKTECGLHPGGAPSPPRAR